MRVLKLNFGLDKIRDHSGHGQDHCCLKTSVLFHYLGYEGGLCWYWLCVFYEETKLLIWFRANQVNKTDKRGEALRKHSLHEKTAASVLLKLFIKTTFAKNTKTHFLFNNLSQDRDKWLKIGLYVVYGQVLNTCFHGHVFCILIKWLSVNILAVHYHRLKLSSNSFFYAQHKRRLRLLALIHPRLSFIAIYYNRCIDIVQC